MSNHNTPKAYESTPEHTAQRVARNKARREAIAAGQAHVGDGKDVDHKKMLDQGGSNDKDNRRVVDAKDNRAWRKDHPSAYGKKK